MLRLSKIEREKDRNDVLERKIAERDRNIAEIEREKDKNDLLQRISDNSISSRGQLLTYIRNRQFLKYKSEEPQPQTDDAVSSKTSKCTVTCKRVIQMSTFSKAQLAGSSAMKVFNYYYIS